MSAAAKYDCSYIPVYEASTPRGKIPLLKTLMTNKCSNDCAYCLNRCSRNVVRTSYEEEELLKLTLHLKSKGVIKGLFLSSGCENPEKSTLDMIRVAEKLRASGYKDYIHLKMMPGVSRDLIRRAFDSADRVGINIEAPERDIFSELCPEKDYEIDVMRRMRWIVEEKKRRRKGSVDTQIIVGALDDNDMLFLKKTKELYDLGVNRIYYSRFIPIPGTPLEKREKCSPKRVYRLYQASFLIRDYGISPDEFILHGENMPDADPKVLIAEAKKDFFPLDINSASKNELMLVPGIGKVLAQRIIDSRPVKSYKNLRRLGVPEKAFEYIDIGIRKIRDLTTFKNGKRA
ncbi:MAG: radical SAM protein [Candidatus Syntropharchaeia archaeon]